MKQRVLTALVMAVVMVPILILGNTWQLFNILILALLVLASIEMRNAFQKTHSLKQWMNIVVIILSVVEAASVYLLFTGMIPDLFIPVTMLVFLTLYCIYVFVPDFGSLDLGRASIQIIYLGLGFASVAALRDGGIYTVVYLLVVTMFTDTFAYVFGIKFGKHRLAPLVSPKKSVEGAIAGLAFGAVFGTAFAVLFDVFSFHLVWIFLLSFVLSILSQIGDLVASKFKREAGVKDFSSIFPGHGGVLDRFDSLMFSAVYLVGALLMASMF